MTAEPEDGARRGTALQRLERATARLEAAVHARDARAAESSALVRSVAAAEADNARLRSAHVRLAERLDAAMGRLRAALGE